MGSRDTFREWLLSVRAARTQQQVAEAAIRARPDCRVYASRISAWERGVGRPSLLQFSAILDGLALSTAERAAGRALWDEAELRTHAA